MRFERSEKKGLRRVNVGPVTLQQEELIFERYP
jgi:hypothetical protein